MRRVLLILLFIVLAALIWQLYQMYLQNRELRGNLSVTSEKWHFLDKENKELMADIEYFSEPENLEKEIRSRFNYKKAGENLIIVVPPSD